MRILSRSICLTWNVAFRQQLQFDSISSMISLQMNFSCENACFSRLVEGLNVSISDGGSCFNISSCKYADFDFLVNRRSYVQWNLFLVFSWS